MKPWILLRIASVTSLLYCAGHGSGFPWTAPEGPENTALVERLRSYRFDVMGASRTVWDFHVGFGLIVSLDLLVVAAILWFLAGQTKRDPAPVRPLIAILGLAFVGNAILVERFFFAVPLVLASIIAFCPGLAFLRTRAPKT
jgi:hypothetical protein